MRIPRQVTIDDITLQISEEELHLKMLRNMLYVLQNPDIVSFDDEDATLEEEELPTTEEYSSGEEDPDYHPLDDSEDEEILETIVDLNKS